MNGLFLTLFLLSPIGLLMGIAKPSLFSRLLKRHLSRKQLTIGFIGLLVLSFFGFGATLPTKVADNNTPPTSDIKSEILPTQTPTTTVGENIGVGGSDKQEVFTVSRVIDGDTIELSDGRRVRYIGIDTPELTQNECFASEATARNRQLVEGKGVRFEKDVSETDRYGRLPRYVYVGDTFVNDSLVREGYANSYTYPPDVKYQNQFLEAQNAARSANKGLWSACRSQTTQSTPTAPTNGGRSCKYSCSGPDKDCSDFSTHAEAQSFFQCCGFSATNDPMRLDSAKGVGNGIACESLP